MKLAFIGGGTMAEAILGGVLAAKLAAPADIHVGEPRADRCQFLSKQYGVLAGQDNLGAARDSDLVILAIKPQDLPMVYKQLGGKLRPGQAALSIIAGAKMASLAQGLNHPAIIRVMPNTPAQIRCGMSLWTCAKEVSPQRQEEARSILGTVGKEIRVDEEKYLDMATALSASGPAYVFLFIESLIDAGVHLGMSRDMARRLVLQTVLGSAQMVKETGRHPAEMRDMVTSPGGTTAEALLALERAGFRRAILDAVIAAYEKSKRLGEQK